MRDNTPEITMVRCIGEDHLKTLRFLKATGQVNTDLYKVTKGFLEHCVEKILFLRDEMEGKQNVKVSYSDTAGVLQLTFGS